MKALSASALVACGGALGALMRFWLSVGLDAYAGTHLPFATFTANVVGSFLIGVFSVVLGGQFASVAFLMTGVLGGFTTFSSFSLETVRMLADGRMVTALAYAGASVVFCLAAAAFGIFVARAA
ncbi:MAG: fluoride efflux transporter CrcB [Pseudomonadota bacterium]